MNIRYPIYEGVYRILTFIFFSCAKMFNEMAQNTRSKANFVFMIKV